ncbi:MAG: GGDEF domain-containing protein [Planctomycetes bacterium]|nr:GGDEF domain-containing protein [Planctomycetota bacterium]
MAEHVAIAAAMGYASCAGEIMGDTQRNQFNTILNAIPDVMVLVDADLHVLSVNASWGHLAREHHAAEEWFRPIGKSYFAACAAIRVGDEKFAADAEAGVREVISGSREAFEIEYPCHTPAEPCYYLLRVSAIPAEGGRAALCAHVDITRRKLAEMELHRETRKLREQSLTDPLTNLRNRRALELLGQQYWSNAQRRGGVLAVVFFDLDGFKPINDNFGHQEGDRVLCYIADYLRATFRESDVIARVGGDEFVVLAWMADAQDLDKIKARLKTKHSMTTAHGDIYEVGMSVGYAVHDPKSEGDLLSLISHADTAMYANKKGRKTRN